MSREIEEMKDDYIKPLIDNIDKMPVDYAQGIKDALDAFGKFYKEVTKQFDGIPMDRLEEMCVAENEGRLVIPPCKIGDTGYYISREDNTIGEFAITGIVIKKDGFYTIDGDDEIDKIGTDWSHLTKQDAQTALKETGDGK